MQWTQQVPIMTSYEIAMHEIITHITAIATTLTVINTAKPVYQDTW